MRKYFLLMAIAPALALAAPAAAPADKGSAKPPDDAARAERFDKQRRVALALQLAEELDLDEAKTAKAHDVLVRADAKAAPLRKQLQEGQRVLRDAARGDAAAAAQVDGTLQKIRDARAQLVALESDLLQQLTQGLSPEKKARAALLLQPGHPGGPGEPPPFPPPGAGPGPGGAGPEGRGGPGAGCPRFHGPGGEHGKGAGPGGPGAGPGDRQPPPHDPQGMGPDADGPDYEG